MQRRPCRHSAVDLRDAAQRASRKLSGNCTPCLVSEILTASEPSTTWSGSIQAATWAKVRMFGALKNPVACGL